MGAEPGHHLCACLGHTLLLQVLSTGTRGSSTEGNFSPMLVPVVLQTRAVLPAPTSSRVKRLEDARGI